jgi:hypothetical protein
MSFDLGGVRQYLSLVCNQTYRTAISRPRSNAGASNKATFPLTSKAAKISGNMMAEFHDEHRAVSSKRRHHWVNPQLIDLAEQWLQRLPLISTPSTRKKLKAAMGRSLP